MEGKRLYSLKCQLAAAKEGVPQTWLFGADEARGENIESQLPTWDAVQSVGGGVFATCGNNDLLHIGGKSLDLGLVSLPFGTIRDAVAEWHAAEIPVWRYWQSAIERPVMQREWSGLQSYDFGFDGVCPFAHCHSAGGKNVADDVDHWYKDSTYVLRTENGVIDTIQWEAYREGRTDVCHATAVQESGGTVPDCKQRDLDEVRDELIDQRLVLEG